MFWSALWGFAAAAGIARTLRDSDYDDIASLVSVGLFSGLVGFGVVAVWVSSAGGHSGAELRYLGLATLLGLSGKEHDRIVRYIITSTLDRLGVPDEEELLGHRDSDHDSNQPDGGDRT